MRSFLLLAALSALAVSAASAVAETTLVPHVGGRVVQAEEGGYRFGWPGVYFEGRFTGPSVEVAVEPGADILAVSIDGQARGEIRGGTARLTLGDLGPGEHVVRLDKLTESQSGEARFIGFRAGEGGVALPPKARPRRMEFVGDSHTVGYGVRSPSRDCTEQQVHDLTDTSQAFGPILARRLDADYRIVAFSGRGVVRNFDGLAPGEPLPTLFPRVIPGLAEPRIDPSEVWRPDLVVIGLGTNDFSMPLHPGEAWADETALRTDYRNAYVAFVQGLAVSRPGARFLLIAGDTFAEDVAEVADRTGAMAVRITGMEQTACHGHPSVRDQQMMADRLAAAIASPPQ